MREIKFRGKRTDKGEWVYGWVFEITQFGSGRHITLIRNYLYMDGQIVGDSIKEINPDTVGQYTGLKDKNGKEIYEGDIIKTHYANVPKADFVEQVVFHGGGFKSEYAIGETGKMWCPLADGVEHLHQDKSMYMEWCEVIGNIHENSELLK